MASSNPRSRVRTGRGQINCAAVAVSARGVRDTKADSACYEVARPCVKARLTCRAARRHAPRKGGSTVGGMAYLQWSVTPSSHVGWCPCS